MTDDEDDDVEEHLAAVCQTCGHAISDYMSPRRTADFKNYALAHAAACDVLDRPEGPDEADVVVKVVRDPPTLEEALEEYGQPVGVAECEGEIVARARSGPPGDAHLVDDTGEVVQSYTSPTDEGSGEVQRGAV